MRMKTLLWLTALLVAGCLGADEGELRPGGGNHHAFRLDRATPAEEVLRVNQARLKSIAYKYQWRDYLAILDELADGERYRVCPGRDFIRTVDPGKVVVYFRHDIDYDPATALRMAEEEKRRNLRASYYLRPTAPYYGEQQPDGVRRYVAMDALYRQIQSMGHEIGVHNDLLSMMILWDIEPLEFQRQELAYCREAGLEVTGVSSHGTPMLTERKLSNMRIFSEYAPKTVYRCDGRAIEYGKYSLADFGFAYESYRAGQTVSLSDVSGLKSGGELLEKLKKCRPGDRVSLLIHPVCWRERRTDDQ